MPGTAKKYQVSEQSIYTWRRRFGTMETSQISELKKVQQENAKLKMLLAERGSRVRGHEGDALNKRVGVPEKLRAVRHAQS